MGKNDINANKVLNNLYNHDLTAKIYYVIYPYNYTKGLFKIKIYKAKPLKLTNTLKKIMTVSSTNTMKKPENEKSRIFHNSKSYEIIDLNSKNKNQTVENELKSKNLEKVNEEHSNDSITSNNEPSNSNSSSVNNNINNSNNNNNSGNQELLDTTNNNTDNPKPLNNNLGNTVSQSNIDEMFQSRKNSILTFNSNDTQKKTAQQTQTNPVKVVFRPVLIENKQSKKPISTKDSQGVYIPKTDKPKHVNIIY